MPNGGRIDFQVGFKTDKSGINQLKQTLQTLQNSLNFQQSKNSLNNQFQQASKAAKELQTILNDSWNSKLGQLNLDKVNTGIKKSYNSVTELRQALNGAGADGRTAFNQFATEVLHANTQIKESNALLNDFADTFGKTVKYGIASSIFNNIKNSLQQAFYFAKDLDLSLTNIRIVTGDSADQMERFSRTANQAAKNLGRSTLDYTNAALTFYQQGLGQQDVNARTQATMMAQNITGVGTEMADYLTAVWNGYKVGAEEAVEYVDKLAAVADSSASDMSQLAIAMSKVASAANVMGVNSDQLNAQLATVIATTRQAPESIGTAFKTIYARINDIKAGTDEAEISLGNYSGKMAQLGFNVFDTNGKLRDTGDVIEDVGEHWQTLTREQQIYLAQVMGGTRQYSRLISLFDNWNMYTDMLNVSLNSQGTLLEKNSRYMDSVKAHMEQLNAETERTYQILSDPSAIKATTEALTKTLTLFNDFIEGLGGGIPVLTYFGSVLVGVFSKQIAGAVDDSWQKISRTFSKKKMTAFLEDIRQNVLAQRKAAGDYDTVNEQASTVAAEKEVKIYERMLTVQKGLTGEQQKRYLQIQKEVGLKTNDLELLKQHRDIAFDLTGNSEATSEIIEEQLRDEKEYLDVLRQQRAETNKILNEYNKNGQVFTDYEQKQNTLQLIANLEQNRTLSVEQRNHLREVQTKLLQGEKLTQSDINIVIQAQNIKEQNQATVVQKIINLLKIKRRVSKGEIEDLEKEIELLLQEEGILNKQGQHSMKMQKGVQLAASLGQILSSAAGAAKVFWDTNATGAEKANSFFSGLQGTISAVGFALGGRAFIFTSIITGVLELLRAIPGVKNAIEGLFTSSAEAMQKTRKAFQETQDSLKVNRKGWSELKSIEEEYETLVSKSGKLTNEEKSRLTQLAEKFATYTDGVITGYDLQGQAIIDKNIHIKDGLKDLDTEYEKIQRNARAQLDFNNLDKGYNDAVNEAELAWENRDPRSTVDQSFNNNLRNSYNTLALQTNDIGEQQYPQISHRLNLILDQVQKKYQKAIQERDLEGLKQAQDMLQGGILGNDNQLGVFSSPEKILSYAVRKENAPNLETNIAWLNERRSIEANNAFFKSFYTDLTKGISDLYESIQGDIEYLQQYEDNIDNMSAVSPQAISTYLLGGDTFNKIRQSYSGSEWADFGQGFWSDIITSLSTGLEKTRDMPNTEDYGKEGEQIIQNLADKMLNVDLLRETLQQKDKEMQDLTKKQGFVSIEQEAEITRKYVKKYLDAIDINKILDEAKSDADGGKTTQEAFQNLMSYFGLDLKDTDVERGMTDMQKNVQAVADKILKKAESSPNYKKGTNDRAYLIDTLSALGVDKFYAISGAIDNLNFDEVSGDIKTFVDQLELLSRSADDTEKSLSNLSSEDEIKLFKALKDGKSYNKITGADTFISNLEARAPELRSIALTEEEGRRSDNWINTAIQTRRKELKQYVVDTEKLYEEAKQQLKKSTEPVDSPAYGALIDNLALLESNWLAAKDALELFNSSLKESEQEIKTTAELLKQRIDLQDNAVSAYEKLREGKGDLSEDQMEALLTLQGQNAELASLDRNSRDYWLTLRGILKTQEETLEAKRQQELIENRMAQQAALTHLKVVEAERESALKELNEDLKNGVLSKDQFRDRMQAIKTEYGTTVDEILNELSELSEKEKSLLLLDTDIWEEKYSNISSMINGFNGLFNNLLDGTASTEDTDQLLELLDDITAKYPQLAEQAEKLTHTWMAGTTQYAAALEDLQQKLYSISIAEAYTAAEEELKDVMKVDLTVELDDSQVQQWMKDVQDFFEQDRNISITVDNALDQEIRKVKKDFDEIYSAASKIGEGFKVSAENIGEVTKVFPEITAGMVELADGSYQLNQQVVQQAVSAAQAEVSANGEAIAEKIKQQAEYHNAKADIYDQIAALAGEMAENEVMTEQDKNSRIGQINSLLSQLQEENKGQLVEYQKKTDDDIKIKKQDSANQIQSINANLYRSLTQMDNAYTARNTENTRTRVQNALNQANRIMPGTYDANGGLDAFSNQTPIQSSYVVIDPGSTAQDVFNTNPDFSTYSTRDWQNLQSQARARAEQEREVARLAMSKYYEIMGKANKTISGLGNVARGQGIEGAKPEKEKEEKVQEPPDPSIEKYLKDEFDRYHDINIILEKINRQLKIMESQQKKLVGKDLINNYQAQLDLLNQQIAAQKQKMGIAQQEAAELRGSLSSQGVAFAGNGQIANYLEVLSVKQNAINEYIGFYNSLTKEEQEYAKDTLDFMKEQYEDLKKDISRYDEIVNTMIPDLTDSIREETQKKVQIMISKSKMAVDIKIDISQLQRDYNNFVKTIKRQVRQDNVLGNTYFAFEDLQSYFKDGIYNSTKAQTDQLYFIMDQIRQINQSSVSEIYGDNKKQALEDLDHYRESLEGDLQNILELVNQIKQNVIKAIEQVQEGFENRQKYYDHISGLLDHDLKMVELIYGDKAYQRMDNLYKLQYDRDVQHLAGLAQEKNFWEQQLIREREHQKTLEWEGQQWYQSQERIKKFEQNWMEATEKLNSSFEDSVQNIIDKYQNGIKKIFHELELQLFNGNTFEYIDTEWQLLTKQSEMYLDNVNRVYAIDKLNSGYDELFKKMKGNTKAQKEINAAKQAEIQSLRSITRLDQGRVDIANQRLRVLEAEKALEDSRNNRSTLQLRRDSQGNYSYQYAADADDNAEKLQTFKDEVNELYNLTKNLREQAYSKIPEMYQEMTSKIMEIRMNQYLDDEEKTRLETLTREKYTQLMQEQADLASQYSIELAKETLAVITDEGEYSYRDVFDPSSGKLTTYLGYGAQSVEAWAQDNEERITQMMQNMIDGPYADNRAAFEEMIFGQGNGMVPLWSNGVTNFVDKIVGPDGLEPIMDETMAKLNQLTEDYRLELDNLADAAQIDTDQIGEGLNNDIQITDELISTNEMLLHSYQNVFDDMMNYWIPTLETYIDKHKELQDAINAVTEAYRIQQEEQRRAAEAATQMTLVNNGDTSLFDGTYNQVHPDISYGGGYGSGYGGYSDDYGGSYGFGGGGFSVGSTVRFLSGRYTADSYGGGTSGDASLGSYVTITYTNPGAPRPYHISGSDYWGNYSDLGWVSEDQLGFKSGGYTGDWNSSSGKWALLHQKELILNAQDTENILNAVNIVRGYNDALNKLQDYQNELLFGSGISSIYSNRQQAPIEQVVHINADFPAVRESREIELAFQNLTNRASQYIFSSR